MRKGRVVDEENEEDEKLRKEFEEFGETVTDKITDKNRPLLVKKLNHLRARRSMSEKLSQSIVKESTKQNKGRKRKGKTAKNEPSRQAELDSQLNADEGEHTMNETFSFSDSSADVGPPAKRRADFPTVTADYASEGPYAVARERAGKMQSSDKSHERSQSESTGVGQSDVLTLPAKTDVRKRGRTRAAGDLSVGGNTVKVSEESETNQAINGHGAQKTALPVKRNARASAVPSTSTWEESIGESTSLSASSVDAKVSLPRVEEGHLSTLGQQKSKLGESTVKSSKSLEDNGKQSAASRIPKLARFPTPSSKQKSATSTAASLPTGAIVVNNLTKLFTHVTDMVSGRPAAGMVVKLVSENQSGTWSHVADSETDKEGTSAELGSGRHFRGGNYRLQYDTGTYFRQQGTKTLYRHVIVEFSIDDSVEEIHIEVAVSPYGHSSHARVSGSQ